MFVSGNYTQNDKDHTDLAFGCFFKFLTKKTYCQAKN